MHSALRKVLIVMFENNAVLCKFLILLECEVVFLFLLNIFVNLNNVRMYRFLSLLMTVRMLYVCSLTVHSTWLQVSLCPLSCTEQIFTALRTLLVSGVQTGKRNAKFRDVAANIVRYISICHMAFAF